MHPFIFFDNLESRHLINLIICLLLVLTVTFIYGTTVIAKSLSEIVTIRLLRYTDPISDRTQFKDWLSKQQPATVISLDDLKAFLYLYLENNGDFDVVYSAFSNQVFIYGLTEGTPPYTEMTIEINGLSKEKIEKVLEEVKNEYEIDQIPCHD